MSAAQAEKLRALLDALVYKSAADYSVTGIAWKKPGPISPASAAPPKRRSWCRTG